MNQRYVDATIQVTATENQGKFGSKRIARETYRMCAVSSVEAARLASENMRSRGVPGCPGHVQVSTQVIGALPLFGEVEETA
jgi:hypothetical protein